MMKTEKARPKVVILYKLLPQYRKAFFELLKKKLDEAGVELILVYGDPEAADASKKDVVDITWAHKIRNRTFRVFGGTFYWQPCRRFLKDADLVIVEQANKLLVNYYLGALRLLGLVRLAFWGHGKNFQARPGDTLSETVKRFLCSKVDWWFAYNATSAAVVKSMGFPEERITLVQNAIDTRALSEAKENVTARDLDALRGRLGLRGGNVAIYSGAMYREKRIPFLLDACQRIKKQVPDFEMIFLGAGPDEGLIRDAEERHDWIHYEGPRFEREKVPYCMLSKLLLMPGLVGLVILDAFALGIPLITTSVPYHSPEIEYLENGVNGEVVTPADDPEAYALRVAFLLKHEDARRVLVEGCRCAANKYTIETMAENFFRGVCAAVGK